MEPQVPRHLTYVSNPQRNEPLGYLDFYNADRNRLYFKMLSSIAGHVSYSMFIKDETEEYFISKFCERTPDGDFKLKYYNINGADTSLSQDFFYIRKKLRVYFNLINNESTNALKELKKKCIHLMKIQAVDNSIRFVARLLEANECQVIQGSELRKMTLEVQRLTNKIDVTAELEDLKKSFDELLV